MYGGCIGVWSFESILLCLDEYRKARDTAKILYERIRNSHDYYLKIADRTNYSIEQILMVKHYIFFNIHRLTENSGIVYKRFVPDLCMAHSWLRLSGVDKPSSKLGTADEKGIEPHDYLLLKHEIYEMQLLLDGTYRTQADAHTASESVYNYNVASEDFYNRLTTPLNNSNKSLEDMSIFPD